MDTQASIDLNLSNIDRAAGISALVQIVGDEHVVFDDAGVELVSRTNIPERHIPDVVVYPGSTEEVQQVMQVANEYVWPVWPVSKGKNWGYGSKSACYEGGITMVLERMNKIHEINEELAYAVIEPGVTYKQLDDHLKQNNYKLWADSSGSTKYASVLGNALDKGRGVTPYADHFGCLCGMEVVLPNGQRMETGGGPEHTYHAKHAYKWGVGPYWDGLFVQSNFGIVTRAGIWLMPEPEKYDFFVFEYTADESQFSEFLDQMRGLIFSGAMQAHVHLANDFAMMCIIAQYPEELLQPGETCLSEQAMTQWRKKFGVSRWTFGCGVYGTRSEVRLRKKAIKKTLGRYGDVRFLGACGEPGLKGKIVKSAARLALRALGKSPQLLEGLDDAIDLFRGIPSDYFARQVYFKSHVEKPVGDLDPARDGCGFIWIGPVVPFTSDHIENALSTVIPMYREHGFDFFVELIVESARSMIVLFGIFFDKEDKSERSRAVQLYEAIRETMMQQGYPPYRASAASTSRALAYSPLQQELGRQIKTTLDPNGILAPAKYGIHGTTKSRTESKSWQT